MSEHGVSLDELRRAFEAAQNEQLRTLGVAGVHSSEPTPHDPRHVAGSGRPDSQLTGRPDQRCVL